MTSLVIASGALCPTKQQAPCIRQAHLIFAIELNKREKLPGSLSFAVFLVYILRLFSFSGKFRLPRLAFAKKKTNK